MSRLVACSARIDADRQTDRQTDTQNDYCNPRCACAPRVNNYYTRCCYTRCCGAIETIATIATYMYSVYGGTTLLTTDIRMCENNNYRHPSSNAEVILTLAHAREGYPQSLKVWSLTAGAQNAKRGKKGGLPWGFGTD